MALPPHLSPFVDDEEEGYVPAQKRVLDEWTQNTSVLQGIGALVPVWKPF